MGPWVGNAGRSAINRFGLWVLVIGIHGALVLLFAFDRSEERGETEADSQSPMTVVFLDRPPPEPPPEEPKPAPSVAAPRLDIVRATPASSDVPAVASSEPSTSVGTPGAIDWEHERAITAQAMLPELLKQNQTKCEAERRPGSMLPKCRQPVKVPEWEPEPGRFGIDGLIPFMRIGKRCAVGLGFFGCAIGKLPEADSHLFDEMRNPDRERSSVPEIDQ